MYIKIYAYVYIEKLIGSICVSPTQIEMPSEYWLLGEFFSYALLYFLIFLCYMHSTTSWGKGNVLMCF